ncbi:MAG TPA: response regulator [Bacteroidetes bacterium]|nr:response regulator [Bacteroidota bacterium]
MTNKSILIAEDNDLNYFVISKMLTSLGTDIIRAENGLKAVEYCKSHEEISLVLMDIKMPVMDGYEATKEIRKIRPDLPIIAQTAHANEYDRDTAFKIGCNDYLTKPIMQDRLIEVVKKYLG